MKKNNVFGPIANSSPNIFWFCALLVFIGMTGSLTIDMYVPSMPSIAHAFSTSSTAIKDSITLYLVTYGLGQLFYGPIADCFGRKKIVLLAVIVGLLGSLCCFYSSSITLFYLGRVLQGAGYAAIAVSAPAMARDVLTDKQFAQAGSILSMVFGLGPVLSPLLGSYISHYFGWRMVFEVISLYSFLVFLAIVFLIPETQDKKDRHQFHIVPILKTYYEIFKHPVFLANAMSKSIAYTGFMVFYTVTPFMLQGHLHLTTVQYGWVTLALTLTILLAKMVNTFILNVVNIEKLIFYSTILLAFSGLLLLVVALTGAYSLYAILIPFMVFGIASGFLFSNTTVVSYQPFKGKAAGSVSGLLSGLQLISAFVGAFIAAHLGLSTLLPLGIFMTLITALVLWQYIYLTRQSEVKQDQLKA